MKVTMVDILRHGECEGGSIYRGSTDVALSDLGWQQMQTSAESLMRAVDASPQETPWDHIISSPLQRCHRFSEKKSQQWGVPVIIEDQFREMHFGDWEGRELNEVWQSDQERVKNFYSNPEKHSPPNGEAVTDVRDRLATAWGSMMTEHRGKHLLLVQHGGTMRVLLTWLLKMPLSGITQFNIPYAGVCRIKVMEDSEGRQHPSILFLNNTSSE
jgi:broad specificity phosphatase PhoE